MSLNTKQIGIVLVVICICFLKPSSSDVILAYAHSSFGLPPHAETEQQDDHPDQTPEDINNMPAARMDHDGVPYQ
ncbi:hypothetical protein CDAR_304671 [Caerostris darwini]|uniref:Secreted protein n=1 Tax=Caerostris darwini TaxID=1538125 RepID=A0AAV4PW29_9ARAC|nr:hypothetical protein CDAR_304671 [Caerostris darwini]